MTITKGFALLLLAFPFFSSAQNGPGIHARKGRKYFANKEFEKAKESYAKALEVSPHDPRILYECGLTYFASQVEQHRALAYYEQALLHSSQDTIPDLLYRLGEACHFHGDFERATTYYVLYKKRTKNDFGASTVDHGLDRRMKMCRDGLILSMKDTKFKADVSPLPDGINTEHSDFTSVLTSDGNTIIFTSRRPLLSSKKDWDGQYFEGLFIAHKSGEHWGKVRPLSASHSKDGAFNRKNRHVAIVSLSPDGRKLYTYTKSKLWVSNLNSSLGWDPPLPMGPEINIGSYNTSIVISPDASMLLVASEAEGGFGGRDLYFSSKAENGQWSELTNLGQTINTPYNDECPYFAGNNTVYFSSQGHNSIGGYDIFRMEWDGKRWSDPQNVGMPVNSSADDMFYMHSPDGKSGYLSSNRIGSMGHMDMFRVDYSCREQEHTRIQGIFATKRQNAYQPTSVILTEELTGDFIGEFPVKADGTYQMTMAPESTYQMEIILNRVDRGRNLKQMISIGKQCEDYPLYQVIHLREETHPSHKEVKATFHNAFFDVSSDFIDLNEREVLLAIGAENGLYSYLRHIEQEGENFTINKDLFQIRLENTQREDQAELMYEIQALYFDYDSHDLRKASLKTLDHVVEVLITRPQLRVNLDGHTDAKGSDHYNEVLARKRALAAKQYLTERGVDPERILVQSFGETCPAAPNSDQGMDSPQNRQKNRRVDMQLDSE